MVIRPKNLRGIGPYCIDIGLPFVGGVNGHIGIIGRLAMLKPAAFERSKQPVGNWGEA
jgi:hypothetical protein